MNTLIVLAAILGVAIAGYAPHHHGYGGYPGPHGGHGGYGHGHHHHVVPVVHKVSTSF